MAGEEQAATPDEGAVQLAALEEEVKTLEATLGGPDLAPYTEEEAKQVAKKRMEVARARVEGEKLIASDLKKALEGLKGQDLAAARLSREPLVESEREVLELELQELVGEEAGLMARGGGGKTW